MNERIRELAKQCQIETYGVNGELLEIGFDAEKFAELIVFECIKIAVFGGDTKTGKAIKEHFGVEE